MIGGDYSKLEFNMLELSALAHSTRYFLSLALMVRKSELPAPTPIFFQLGTGGLAFFSNLPS